MTAIPTSSDLHQMRDQLAEEIRRFAIDRRLPDGTWRDPNDRERAMRMTNAYAALESRIRDEDMWRDEAPEVPEVGLDDASRDARDQLDALVDQASAWARETPPLPDVGAGDNNAYRTAFCRYVARGAGALSASEFGLLQARTSQLRADGHPSFRNEGSQGITAPPVIANQIIRAEKSFGGLDGAAITRHVSTGFETMEWPVEVDNDEGEWSGDDRTSTGETSIPTQRVLPLDLHSLDSRFIVLPTKKLLAQLDDAAVERLVMDTAVKRIGRSRARARFAGDGYQKPTGLNHPEFGAPLGHSVSGAITGMDFVRLYLSCPAAVRDNEHSQFIVSPRAFAELITQTVALDNGNVEPLWRRAEPGSTRTAQGAPATIFGRSYLVDHYCGVGDAPHVFYGDVSYIHDRAFDGVQVERVSDSGLVRRGLAAWIVIGYFDSRFMDPSFGMPGDTTSEDHLSPIKHMQWTPALVTVTQTAGRSRKRAGA